MKKFVLSHPLGTPLFKLEKKHGALNNPDLRDNRNLLLRTRKSVESLQRKLIQMTSKYDLIPWFLIIMLKSLEDVEKPHFSKVSLFLVSINPESLKPQILLRLHETRELY